MRQSAQLANEDILSPPENRPPRLIIPGPAGEQQQARQTGKLNLSDGYHSHYLDLDLDSNLGPDLDLSLPSRVAMPSPTPLERFWDEPHRHEHIALMMRQLEVAPRALPRVTTPTEAVFEGDRLRETWTSPSPRPRGLGAGVENGAELKLELEVDDNDGDGGEVEVPDLETIRILARIR